MDTISFSYEREYDGLIGLTFYNLSTMLKNDKMVLINFDRKNIEHLFILRVALMVRDIHNIELYLDCSNWQRFLLNWKMRKGFRKIRKINSKETVTQVDVVELLNLMRPDGIARLGENFSFTDIYKAYYEGSLN